MQSSRIGEKDTNSFLKKKRIRTTFHPKQKEILEKNFAVCQFSDVPLQIKLSSELGISRKSVQIWFKNRRIKERNINRQQMSTNTNVFSKDLKAISKPESSVPSTLNSNETLDDNLQTLDLYPFQTGAILNWNDQSVFDSKGTSDLSSARLSASSYLRENKRQRMTISQRQILEECFKECRNPNSKNQRNLAIRLGVPAYKIQNWFKNRRSKESAKHLETGINCTVNYDNFPFTKRCPRSNKRFRPEQKTVLEDVYKQTRSPDRRLQMELSNKFGISTKSIQIWFKNRRKKEIEQIKKSHPLENKPLFPSTEINKSDNRAECKFLPTADYSSAKLLKLDHLLPSLTFNHSLQQNYLIPITTEESSTSYVTIDVLNLYDKQSENLMISTNDVEESLQPFCTEEKKLEQEFMCFLNNLDGDTLDASVASGFSYTTSEESSDLQLTTSAPVNTFLDSEINSLHQMYNMLPLNAVSQESDSYSALPLGSLVQQSLSL